MDGSEEPRHEVVQADGLDRIDPGAAGITTARGEVPVAQLAVGDLVVTASGASRRVVGAGRRTGGDPEPARRFDVRPVRIAAHAFGAGRPSRDLVVSADQAICVDLLIPASALVNGCSVRRVETDEAVWRIELEQQDILFCEHLGCESRAAEGNVTEDGSAKDPICLRPAPEGHCRPVFESGPVVEAIRTSMRQRSRELGWVLDDAIDLHLEVDGRRLEPLRQGLTARFEIPAGASDIWLVAPTARPCDTGDSSDTREVGLYISGLRIEDGLSAPHDIAIDDPLLCVGFHGAENGGCRWTAARARLPAALWQGRGHSSFLRVELCDAPVPRWRWQGRWSTPAAVDASGLSAEDRESDTR